MRPSIASEVITYRYDGRGRVVQAIRNGTVNNNINSCYGYDKADNRTIVTVAGSDCSGAPPSFSINNASATEGGSLVFTVTKAGGAAGTYGVSFATASGTAVAGSDYNAATGTLTFAATDPSTKTISVTTINDAAVESSETLTVGLSAATGGATIGGAQGTGTIVDNDAAPVCNGVSFTIASNGAVTEGANSVFTVTKTGTATGSCGVDYASANGTAAAGSDYAAISGTLPFTTGQSTRTISLPTTDDTTAESAETLSMSVSAPTGGAVLGIPSSATATLNDNDSTGGTGCTGVSFNLSDYAGDEGETFVFNITKTGTTSSSCSVNYTTANGTAVTPNDYSARSGTLTFTPAQTTLSVSVTTVVAGPGEGTESFTLNLSAATGGAGISDSQGVGTLYNYLPDGGCPLC
ncbi:MAG: hypothetical protein QOJ91_2314 [Sphingomonadales bacterium]|nr:hypothetical protein [Sphingomonadales bacterium]